MSFETVASEGGAQQTPDRIAIAASGLGKRFEIYDQPYQRLLQTLMRGRRTFYREFWALAAVDLAVCRGETVGIVGRNGSGKSTLLQLVAGTLAPTTGTVSTSGRVAALLELGSGFNTEFTGRENVYLNGAILGISRREMDEAFGAIEAFAEIGDFIDQPVKTYSSGMLVRLAFSVAVHVTPDVLIVDEALGVGDTAFQSKCLERIRRMQQAGVAMLLVSHAPNTIIEFCDRAIYLDRGRVQASGPCHEVVKEYTNDMVRGYGGTPLPPRISAAGEGGAAPAAASGLRTEILSVTIRDAAGAQRLAFEHGETMDVQVDVAYHHDNAAPCFGIQIKSTDDIVLWTCTTQLMDRKVAPGVGGTRASYRWRMRAMFGGGRYLIAIGTGDIVTGFYVPHSRMHYAGHFDVLAEPRRGSGWLEPEARFEQAA